MGNQLRIKKLTEHPDKGLLSVSDSTIFKYSIDNKMFKLYSDQ